MNQKQWIKFEVLVLTAILAFCSIVYELLLSNTLAIVTGNYIWWQSLTIGVYIGGLGLGAYFSDRLKDPLKNFVWVELALSFLGVICVVYVYFFHGIYKYLDNMFFFTGDFYSSMYLQNLFILKFIFFFCIQALTLLIGLLSGFEIPLMMQFKAIRMKDINEEEDHFVLGVNYFGTLIGTICFAYWLLPKLDVIKAAVFTASLNLLVCIYFILRYQKANRSMFGGFVVAVAFAISSVFMGERAITQSYLKFFYYLPKILAKNNVDLNDLIRRVNQLPPIERTKSLYQYVDIFNYPSNEDGTIKDSTILTIDTNFQFNTTTEFFYHQAFAHVSIALNKKVPRKVLMLGGGDGLLLRELLKYKEIERIDAIELDQKMIDLAKGRFAELNKRSLFDPRVNVQINDGFYFVRTSHEKYDAVYIDFPYPNSYDLSRLYSVEFYSYVKRVLNPGGFVVLDAPFYNKIDYTQDRYQGRVMFTQVFNDIHELSNSVLASTFYYAGFNSFFPYRISDESFIFVKTDPGQIDFNFMDNADLSKLEPQIISEMKEIKNQDFPYRIASKYVNSIFKPTMVRKNEF